MIQALARVCSALLAILVVAPALSDEQRRPPGSSYGAYTMDNTQSEVTFSDPTTLPPQLARMLYQTGCYDYEEEMRREPVRVHLSVPRWMGGFAIVRCRLGVFRTDRVYYFRYQINEPTLVRFPFMAPERGFGLAINPGPITWDASAKTLTTVIGTDMCPSNELRHTYSFRHATIVYSDGVPFVLERVEVRQRVCTTADTPGPWQSVWEAPRWPENIELPN